MRFTILPSLKGKTNETFAGEDGVHTVCNIGYITPGLPTIETGPLANSEVPDEMSRDMSFNLCLHCLLQKDSTQRQGVRGSRKFCQRGSNFDNVFFLIYEGKDDLNTTISRASSARQRNVILMAFRWRADGGPTLNAGLVAL